MATNLPFTYNPNNSGTAVPFFPGAYLIDGNPLQFAVPIYGSMNFANFNFSNKDNYLWLLPGFKIITYNDTDASVVTTAANTTNKIAQYSSTTIDRADYCKLYYNTGTAEAPTWTEITGAY